MALYAAGGGALLEFDPFLHVNTLKPLINCNASPGRGIGGGNGALGQLPTMRLPT